MFEGLASGPGSLIKYNPLSNYDSNEVWNFLRVMDVPTNDLHACGYISIGCEPCTRAVLPNQQEREGRWWWEDTAAKECGLHSGNVKKGEEGGAGAGPLFLLSSSSRLASEQRSLFLLPLPPAVSPLCLHTHPNTLSPKPFPNLQKMLSEPPARAQRRR